MTSVVKLGKGEREAIRSAVSDFDKVVEQYHRTMEEFYKGNPKPIVAMFSHREDITLANPFGPVKRGLKQVTETAEHAATYFRDGEDTTFENVSKYVTPELAYIVEVERFKARVGGGKDLTPVAERVTTIFRREDGVWKFVHRQADAIVAAQSPESVIQK